MDENNKTVDQGNKASEAVEQTFTKADIEAIVSTRLARDRKERYPEYEALKEKAAKYDEMEEASKSELQKATEKAASLQAQLDTFKRAEELRGMRESIAAELGVPAVLLTAETEEACRTQAEAVLSLTGSQKGYPTVRDGGEVSGHSKGSPKQQFAEWADRAFGN